ncbi:hypothetical protein BJ912DRAFT_1063341 [Pholiota molesta]|nr:hypothetical protein BJ912DRAFT_1063341 [Pholiota molesta]
MNDEEIEARDPSLINLPLPLPSIPVLSPILSPIVGGSPSSSKTPSSTPTTAPAASTPTPSSPAASSTPSSGSGGSSGSGDTGSSGSGTGSTGGSGSAGGGDPASSGAAQPSGGSSTSTADASSPSATQSGASPSGTASAGSTATGTNLSTSGNSGSDGSSSSSGGNTGGEPGTANAGGLPSGNSSGSASGSLSIGSNGLPVSTQANGDSGNTSGTTTGNNTVAATGKSHTSAGVVVAIVLVVLLFLAVLALGYRRRQRARRNDRANKWWFTKNRTSQTYGDGDRNSTEIIPAAAGSRSARSSFATTVDHSTTPQNGSFIIPPLPPMAEVGRTDGRVPALVIDVSHFGNDPRFSIGSQGSNDSQYLVVNHRDSTTTGEMVGTPMSVRPFSPSESFAFPKPPDPAGDRTSGYSRPSSTATTATLNYNNKSPTISPYTSYGEIIPPIPGPTFPAPALVSPIGAEPVANPFADNNPFEDTPLTPTPAIVPVPAAAAPPTVAGAFAEVEYIKRPFNPSLTDELRVAPDDGVRVLQTFDDGWALVEKVSSSSSASAADGTGAAGNYGKGLIPIDCLREPGQSLPSFFAVKRVSNYAESTHTVSSESPFAFSAF